MSGYIDPAIGLIYLFNVFVGLNPTDAGSQLLFDIFDEYHPSIMLKIAFHCFATFVGISHAQIWRYIICPCPINNKLAQAVARYLVN